MPAGRRRTNHNSTSSPDNHRPGDYRSDDFCPGPQHDCCPWCLLYPRNHPRLQ